MAAPTLVMATRNPGKVRELNELLKDLGIKLLSLEDFPDLPEIAEDGASFAENAVAKARQVAGLTGLPALADDSGLEVAALGGRPGVFSARYAQEGAYPGLSRDEANWRQLLAELEGVPLDQRQASFVCEMALALPDGRLYHARGECHGLIALTPQGDKGFGYDPVFWVPAYGHTMAELEVGVKNAISHRGRALAALKVLLASLKDQLANFCQDNRGVAQPG